MRGQALESNIRHSPSKSCEVDVNILNTMKSNTLLIDPINNSHSHMFR